MDADALTKITKASVKDVIVSNLDVYVAGGVEGEVVDEGKARGYPDALVVEDNIRKGRVRVVDTTRDESTEGIVEGLHLLGGEADSVRLFRQGGYDVIASGDQRFLDLIDGLSIPFTTPTALLLYLWKTGRLSQEGTRRALEKMSGFVSPEEYMVSMEELGR